jgi:hypothetical protein
MNGLERLQNINYFKVKDDFGYIVSTNEGEFYKYGIKTRIEADNLAIERATEDYNERNS